MKTKPCLWCEAPRTGTSKYCPKHRRERQNRYYDESVRIYVKFDTQGLPVAFDIKRVARLGEPPKLRKCMGVCGREVWSLRSMRVCTDCKLMMSKNPDNWREPDEYKRAVAVRGHISDGKLKDGND